MELLLPSLTGRRDPNERRLASARGELLRLWAHDPWEWLTGQDLDGRPLIWTKDERSKDGSDSDAPLKPFPRDKPYLRRFIMEDAYAMDGMPLFTDKARQMYISTSLLLLMDWIARFHLGRRGIVSKHKEGESEQLLRDKVRSVHLNLPLWVQQALPISMTPANRIDYPLTGSSIHGVAQNFAVAEARGQTASVVLVDEAAFQDVLQQILTAVLPMASRLWVVTTPQVVGRGAKVFKNMIDGKKMTA